MNCYSETLKSVELTLPVNFSRILKFVCDLAQTELGLAGDSQSIKNYYVLVLVMAGVIDD